MEGGRYRGEQVGKPVESGWGVVHPIKELCDGLRGRGRYDGGVGSDLDISHRIIGEDLFDVQDMAGLANLLATMLSH